MKFSQIVKGIRAEKAIEIPIQGGDAVPAIVRPLSAIEACDVVAQATAFAKAKGVPDASYGHPVFDSAIWAHTLLLATLDKDSPKNAREPFFASAEEILKDFDTDALAAMHTHQAIWQEECSPVERAKTLNQLFEITKRVAGEGGESFFVLLSARTQMVWARTIASLFTSSPELSALFTSPSATSPLSGAIS